MRSLPSEVRSWPKVSNWSTCCWVVFRKAHFRGGKVMIRPGQRLRVEKAKSAGMMRCPSRLEKDV